MSSVTNFTLSTTYVYESERERKKKNETHGDANAIPANIVDCG